MTNERSNAILAFTEWLDENKKTYLIIIRDVEGDDVNLCAVNGNHGKLSSTIASGMIEHKELREVFSDAVLKMAMHEMNADFNLKEEDGTDDV